MAAEDGGLGDGTLSREQLLYALENLGARRNSAGARARELRSCRACKGGVGSRARAPARARAAARSLTRRGVRRARARAGEALSREDLEQCIKALTGKADAEEVFAEVGGASEFAEGVLGFEETRADDAANGHSLNK